MTPRQENSIERAVGRIEAQLEALSGSISRLTEKADQADEWRHEVRERLEKNEAHGANMARVAEAFDALQQSIHEGTVKTRSFLSGAAWGVALAGGAVGATVATFFKSFAAWVGTLFPGA